LADLQHHSLPAQGTENISILQKVWKVKSIPHISILQKVWKVKSIPPFLKTFAWRLIRRALTAAERDGRYSTHLDQHCIHCGAIENDAYLLFLCDLITYASVDFLHFPSTSSFNCSSGGWCTTFSTPPHFAYPF
jgi:hypothetical protein